MIKSNPDDSYDDESYDNKDNVDEMTMGYSTLAEGHIEHSLEKNLLNILQKLKSADSNLSVLLNVNAIATLIDVSPARISRILVHYKDEIQIFNWIKELDYPENTVIVSLRLIKLMCISGDISTHLVKQSNIL